jgi:hypothetical protein
VFVPGDWARVEGPACADVDGDGVGSKPRFKRNDGGEEENEDKVEDGDRMNDVGEVSSECIASGSETAYECNGER